MDHLVGRYSDKETKRFRSGGRAGGRAGGGGGRRRRGQAEPAKPLMCFFPRGFSLVDPFFWLKMMSKSLYRWCTDGARISAAAAASYGPDALGGSTMAGYAVRDWRGLASPPTAPSMFSVPFTLSMLGRSALACCPHACLIVAT